MTPVLTIRNRQGAGSLFLRQGPGCLCSQSLLREKMSLDTMGLRGWNPGAGDSGVHPLPHGLSSLLP